MKKLQKIAAMVMVAALLITFASCKKDDKDKEPITQNTNVSITSPETSTTEPTTEPVSESETSTTAEPSTKAKDDKKPTTTKPKSTNSNNSKTTTTKPNTNKTTTTTTTKPTTTTLSVEQAIIGTWSGTYNISVKEMFEEDVNSNVNINLRYTVTYNKDGSCSSAQNITNVAAVKAEVKRLILETEGIPADQLSPEEMAEIDAIVSDEVDAMNEILNETAHASYTVSGNKITYTENGVSFYETFTLSGNTLTLTGNSIDSTGYPIKLTRA